MERAFRTLSKGKIFWGFFLKEKVFVSVGTHPQAFDRLLRQVDEIASEKNNEFEFFGQTGHCIYVPKNFRFKNFLTDSEFEEKVKNSSLVIGHAGAGLIINALKENKKIIIVPRLKEFQEHTNSHQVDLAKALEKEKKVISVYDISKLGETILKSRKFTPFTENQTKKIVEELEKFVSQNG